MKKRLILVLGSSGVVVPALRLPPWRTFQYGQPTDFAFILEWDDPAKYVEG